VKIDIKKLEKALAERGWRKADLADALGVSRSWVSQVVTKARDGGEFEPHVVGRLATGFGIGVDAITQGEQEDAA
jgi:transcriptional regulator with XRE-family HTH domain